MFVRQFLHYDTFTYSYLLADTTTGVAAIIDPVKSEVPRYLQIVKELGLRLTLALDTHVHADHVTALGELKELAEVETYVGLPDEVPCADHALHDNDVIRLGSLNIIVFFTPGHTNDSFCFYVKDDDKAVVFTGDTLLIRGTGRTDFQNGDASELYHSLHEILFKLNDSTIVYPGHDYRGATESTIGEERKYNPRALISNKSEFVAYMGNLDLANPKWMDVAVPANLSCGKKALGGEHVE